MAVESEVKSQIHIHNLNHSKAKKSGTVNPKYYYNYNPQKKASPFLLPLSSSSTCSNNRKIEPISVNQNQSGSPSPASKGMDKDEAIKMVRSTVAGILVDRFQEMRMFTPIRSSLLLFSPLNHLEKDALLKVGEDVVPHSPLLSAFDLEAPKAIVGESESVMISAIVYALFSFETETSSVTLCPEFNHFLEVTVMSIQPDLLLQELLPQTLGLHHLSLSLDHVLADLEDKSTHDDAVRAFFLQDKNYWAIYPPPNDARVMRDQKTGRSRRFGFLSLRSQQEAQSAINNPTGKWVGSRKIRCKRVTKGATSGGKWVGSRQIRCNWATKGANIGDDNQSTDGKSVVELTNGSSEDGKETTNSEAPENSPQYTTVYVENLGPKVTLLDLHRHFHQLGAGSIEEVRVQRDTGFGFVRYSTHAEAALAIQFVNNPQFGLLGKQIKCSWGSKPTPPGTASNPLPPPAPAPLGLSADLVSYERQLAMSKMGGMHALMHAQGPHPLNMASMGMGGAGASHAIYDGGFQNLAAQ